MTRSRDIATQGGLVLVNKTAIGSAVSSIVVSNAFSATYDNYLIIVNGGVASNTGDFSLKLGASATGYYYGYGYGQFTTGGANSGAANQTGFNTTAGSHNANFLSARIELQNPFLAKQTLFSTLYSNLGGGNFVAGYHNVATSYTDFTLTPQSGTLTGGTIKVYGYR